MADDVQATLREHGAKLDELLSLVRELVGRDAETLETLPGLPAPAHSAPRRAVTRPVHEQIESLEGPARDIAARLRLKRVAKLQKEAAKAAKRGQR